MKRKAILVLLAVAIIAAAGLVGMISVQAQNVGFNVSVSCPQITFFYFFGEGRSTGLEYASVNQIYEGYVYRVTGPEGYNVMAQWPDPQTPVSVDVGVPGTYVIEIGYQWDSDEAPASDFGPMALAIDWFDSTQVEVDCPVVKGFNCPVTYVILGSVLVYTPQPGFDYAGGEQARDSNKNPIVLPIDADHGGVDEYLIIQKDTYAGEEWYGLFIGGCNPVWAPSSKVVRVR